MHVVSSTYFRLAGWRVLDSTRPCLISEYVPYAAHVLTMQVENHLLTSVTSRPGVYD